MKKIILAMSMTMLLGGCSEVEFGSYLFKSASNDAPYIDTQIPSRPTQQGTFKVGKPYTVGGTVYRPAETYNYSRKRDRLMVWPRFSWQKDRERRAL